MEVNKLDGTGTIVTRLDTARTILSDAQRPATGEPTTNLRETAAFWSNKLILYLPWNQKHRKKKRGSHQPVRQRIVLFIIFIIGIFLLSFLKSPICFEACLKKLPEMT